MSATFLEVIPEITIAPDVVLEIVIALNIVIEIAITGMDSTSDFFRPPFLFQQPFAKEFAADFPDPAFCLFDSTFELIPIHDFLLTTISRISHTALTGDPASLTRHSVCAETRLIGAVAHMVWNSPFPTLKKSTRSGRCLAGFRRQRLVM
ncbi:MAG TPA: hypothetical protein VLB06_06190 [Sulfuricaulis sp.]|nr:hypothetical protein [Sulfuricaulis sp.]